MLKKISCLLLLTLLCSSGCRNYEGKIVYKRTSNHIDEEYVIIEDNHGVRRQVNGIYGEVGEVVRVSR